MLMTKESTGTVQRGGTGCTSSAHSLVAMVISVHCPQRSAQSVIRSERERRTQTTHSLSLISSTDSVNIYLIQKKRIGRAKLEYNALSKWISLKIEVVVSSNDPTSLKKHTS